MAESQKKINSFRDLNAWKYAFDLSIKIYRITDKFPPKEIYSLTNQIRRCSISISSNIAEGFSRQTKKEKIHFYHISKGSLTELENQILLSAELKYISENELNDILELVNNTGKLITGLIKSLQK